MGLFKRARILFAFFLFSTPLVAQDSPSPDRGFGPESVGSVAGYATQNASAISMMGWGIGLAAGIAALCILIPNDSGTSH